LVIVLNEVNILIGGPQGAGLETSSQIITISMVHLGYGVISDREYHSNIIGRHSYIHMKISSKEIPLSLEYPVDVIAGMDAETIFTHFHELKDNGILIYDIGTIDTKLTEVKSMEKEVMKNIKDRLNKMGLGETLNEIILGINARRVGIDFKELISNLIGKFKIPSTHASRYISSIVIGAMAHVLKINMESIRYALDRRFEGRLEIIEPNMYIIELVKKYVDEDKTIELEKPNNKYDEYLVVSGNDIVAMAKIVGGLRYQSYYPITPAADESLFLEANERIKLKNGDEIEILVFQTEDEIAAITSAIGAALSGARSSTTTSGPGFSLMVEALGWAGNNEVPIVITYYQRGAPSTGLPTRGGQGDLLFTLSASHGEFPRIVLASGDHLEAFYDTIEAFNLAERYQVPVIHLLDKFLANTIASIPIPSIEELNIDRGLVVDEAVEYKRFDLSKIISPRAYIGSKTISWYTGDEHNDEGHITEEPNMRMKMYEKRMRKMEIMSNEIPEKLKYTFTGDGEDYLIVGWGSIKGVCIDAIRELNRGMGLSGAYLNIKMFSPFPSKEIMKILSKYDQEKIIIVENNYLTQAAKIISMYNGVQISKKITKYTGRPIYKNELVNAIKNILEGKSEWEVLIYGA